MIDPADRKMLGRKLRSSGRSKTANATTIYSFHASAVRPSILISIIDLSMTKTLLDSSFPSQAVSC